MEFLKSLRAFEVSCFNGNITNNFYNNILSYKIENNKLIITNHENFFKCPRYSRKIVKNGWYKLRVKEFINSLGMQFDKSYTWTLKLYKYSNLIKKSGSIKGNNSYCFTLYIKLNTMNMYEQISGDFFDLINLRHDIEIIKVKLNQYSKIPIVKSINLKNEIVLSPSTSSILIHECLGHYSEDQTIRFFKSKITAFNYCSGYYNNIKMPLINCIDDLGNKAKNIIIFGKCSNKIETKYISFECLKIMTRMSNLFVPKTDKSISDYLKNFSGVYIDCPIKGYTNKPGEFKILAGIIIYFKEGAMLYKKQNIWIKGNLKLLSNCIPADDFKWYIDECVKRKSLKIVANGSPSIIIKRYSFKNLCNNTIFSKIYIKGNPQSHMQTY